VDEAGRVWTPRELRDGVLDEFERSGMSATQFAKRLGVKYPTFASWVQQRRRERGAGDKLQWVEATVAAPTVSPRKALTVHLPGGARVEVGDVGQAKMTAVLLRELSAGGAVC
jgi:transposase-like protein